MGIPKRSARALGKAHALVPEAVSDEVLAELIRRVRDIEAAYRGVAQHMGQLYIYADQHDLALLTRELDHPMRNASDNERAMASILDELQLSANRRHQRGT